MSRIAAFVTGLIVIGGGAAACLFVGFAVVSVFVAVGEFLSILGRM